MSRRSVSLVLSLALCVVGLAGQAAQEKPPAPKFVDIAGKWTITLELEIGTSTPGLVIKQDADKLTGTYTSARYGTFEWKGILTAERRITFAVNLDADGQPAILNFTGEVAATGATMGGKVQIEGLGDGTWSAKKNPEK